MVIIVLNLKQLRNSLGLSQAEVASHLNISRAAYTNIENGKRDPDTQTLLAQIYKDKVIQLHTG